MGRSTTLGIGAWATLRAAATVFEIPAVLGVNTAIHPDRVMKLVQSTRIAPGWLTGRGYEFTTSLEQALALWRDETGGEFCWRTLFL